MIFQRLWQCCVMIADIMTVDAIGSVYGGEESKIL